MYLIYLPNLLAELNNSHQTPEEMREIFSEIIGKSVDISFGMFSPFHTDFGKDVTVVLSVSIGNGAIVAAGSGVTENVPQLFWLPGFQQKS